MNNAFKTQFNIQFFFFLLGLIACLCAICYSLGGNNWIMAPALVIDGLLFWHTRQSRYAVLPGILIGFIVGIVLNLAVHPVDIIATGVWVATYGVPINAICIGYWKTGLIRVLI